MKTDFIPNNCIQIENLYVLQHYSKHTLAFSNNVVKWMPKNKIYKQVILLH